MATAYKTPGVYIEEIPKFPPSIAAVETAIPAFIGYTEIAKELVDGDLHLKPKRISSMVEYERFFGLPQNEEACIVTISTTGTAVATLDKSKRSRHLMYYSLQLFFANGGGPCYVISVGSYKSFSAGVPGILVKNELNAGLLPLSKVDEPTLIIFPESQWLSISDYQSLHDAALLQCATLKDRFVIMDMHGDADGDADGGVDNSMFNAQAQMNTAVTEFRTHGIGTGNLKYGAVYAPNVATTLDYAYDESMTVVKINGTDKKLSELRAGSDVDSLNYERSKAALRDLECILPPSGAIAGVYARVDQERGVWKAPANVSLNAVVRPTIPLTDADQETMNVDPTAGKSVNAIRSFTGKGTLIWGGRTLAGNDLEWRYINVRRTFIFIEESIKKATEQFVFDPNDANTWVKVQAMIENFLTTLWRQGALQGVKPEHAFYVAVGLGKTMSAIDILEGRLIIEIGLAVVRPAEFIILRFSHKMAQS
ncbi:MAG: phage tail sheath family protein [Candidatus Kapabacteria bacterium]|nr:phage tail sheath family protein [Candidatus Kapabacteria bacterium]